MGVPKDKARELLTSQIGPIKQLRQQRRGSIDFDKWRTRSKSIISNLFGDDSPQLKDFCQISYSLSFIISGTPDSDFQKAYLEGLDTSEAQLEALVAEVESFWQDETVVKHTEDPLAKLSLILGRFHSVARQLRVRHGKRSTLEIKDEYDIQDLLHALLKLYFDDIRAEEWTPSYAGGSSRMDFLLKNERIVIEVKRTSMTFGEKEIGDQLLIDIKRYQAHPDCLKLICFVYDPEGVVGNPVGLENDLRKHDGKMEVMAFICPK